MLALKKVHHRRRATEAKLAGKNERKLYRSSDWARYKTEHRPSSPGRSEVDRDYARVIHSPSFRRLQGKTQLFPGHESDYFRNRLTHSLEVAQIAESIARNLNATDPYLQKNPLNLRLCHTAALLHDIGHPPFGHNGEAALDKKMLAFGGFEGNAQTLRIVSQLEKKVVKPGSESLIERRCGLNLSYRQLASILKYDQAIPSERANESGVCKGYYNEDQPVVDDLKKAVLGSKKIVSSFKTIECAIMDIADDIAYSTYDLEDSFKAGFLSPMKVLSTSSDIFVRVAKKVAHETDSYFDELDAFDIFIEMFSQHVDKEVFEENIPGESELPLKVANALFMISELNIIAEDGRARTDFTSSLVGEFVDAVTFDLNENTPSLSKIKVPTKTLQKIETLKRFTYEATIKSSRLRLAEHRGYEVVSKIFDALATDGNEVLLPDDQYDLWKCAENKQQRMRVICDFIAGMTDRYALEFYGRLYSDNPVSFFKTA